MTRKHSTKLGSKLRMMNPRQWCWKTKSTCKKKKSACKKTKSACKKTKCKKTTKIKIVIGKFKQLAHWHYPKKAITPPPTAESSIDSYDLFPNNTIPESTREYSRPLSRAALKEINDYYNQNYGELGQKAPDPPAESHYLPTEKKKKSGSRKLRLFHKDPVKKSVSFGNLTTVFFVKKSIPCHKVESIHTMVRPLTERDFEIVKPKPQRYKSAKRSTKSRVSSIASFKDFKDYPFDYDEPTTSTPGVTAPNTTPKEQCEALTNNECTQSGQRQVPQEEMNIESASEITPGVAPTAGALEEDAGAHRAITEIHEAVAKIHEPKTKRYEPTTKNNENNVPTTENNVPTTENNVTTTEKHEPTTEKHEPTTEKHEPTIEVIESTIEVIESTQKHVPNTEAYDQAIEVYESLTEVHEPTVAAYEPIAVTAESVTEVCSHKNELVYESHEAAYSPYRDDPHYEVTDVPDLVACATTSDEEEFIDDVPTRGSPIYLPLNVVNDDSKTPEVDITLSDASADSGDWEQGTNYLYESILPKALLEVPTAETEHELLSILQVEIRSSTADPLQQEAAIEALDWKLVEPEEPGQPEKLESDVDYEVANRMMRRLYEDVMDAREIKHIIGSAKTLNEWIKEGKTTMPEINDNLFTCIDRNGALLEKIYLQNGVEEEYKDTAEQLLRASARVLVWHSKIVKVFEENGYTSETISKKNSAIRDAAHSREVKVASFRRPPCGPLIIANKHLEKVKRMY